MAHNCGTNSKTYQPPGDGIDANLIVALGQAAAEYGTSECSGRLASASGAFTAPTA